MRALKPLCYDLFCGLGGWAEGFLAEDWDVIGFDIEAHDYGTGGYPGKLILRDVLSIHGSELADADCIVASPPCQAYSYRAMPWSRAKALPPPSNKLFDACFRIQKQANYAAGRECANCGGHGFQGHSRECSYCNGGWIHADIPLVVENVRGAVKWVSEPVRWHFGSFYLWGDVPVLMPPACSNSQKLPEHHDTFEANGKPCNKLTDPRYGSNRLKVPGKQNKDGTKVGGEWFGSYAEQKSKGTISPGRLYGKNSDSRKAASAQIAKIPFPLARWIAQVYDPRRAETSVRHENEETESRHIVGTSS